MTGGWDRDAAMAALLKAVPFLRLYRERLFVVKLGGSACAEPATLRHVVEQVAVLEELGIRVVLVHGGGEQVTALCHRLGIEVQVVGGRRVTSPAALEAAVMAINGSVRTAILAACQAVGLKAVGVSGVDAGLIRARRRPPSRVKVEGKEVEVAWGEVGDVVGIDGGVLNRLVGAGFLPVVSCLAVGERGEVLNVNADTVAARLAASLGAEKLIFLTGTAGLLEDPADPGSLVSYVDLAGLAGLEERGALRDGMLPKVAAAREALTGGVGRVHMVGVRQRWGILAEVFTNEGAGTLIVRTIADLALPEQTPKATAELPLGGA